MNFPAAGQEQAVKSGLGGWASKYVGVYWTEQGSTFRIRIRTPAGKRLNIGQTDSEEEAARIYDKHAAAMGKPVNFPKSGQARASKKVSFIGAHAVKKPFKYLGVRWPFAQMKWEASIRTVEGEESQEVRREKSNWKNAAPAVGKKTVLGFFGISSEAALKCDEAAACLGRPLNFSGDGPKRFFEIVSKSSPKAHIQNKVIPEKPPTKVPEGPYKYTLHRGVLWCRYRRMWKVTICLDRKGIFSFFFFFVLRLFNHLPVYYSSTGCVCTAPGQPRI